MEQNNQNQPRPRRPSPPNQPADSVSPDGLSTQQTDPAQSQTTPQSTPSPTGIYASHQEYFQCLQQWIWAYQWHRMCWEQQQRDRMYWQQMSMMQTMPTMHPTPNPGFVPNTPGHIQPQMAGVARVFSHNAPPPSGPGHPQILVNAVGPNNQIDPAWRGFKIAPIWKRVCAEFIDIAILMLVKVLITYTLFDLFFFLDFKKYQDFIDLDVELTYDTARELLFELAIMELAHRFIGCLYEAIMTVRGFQFAGATYGKRFMGLRVVTCEEYILLDNMILVKPAGTPSFIRALSRAFLKNYSWAFFLPLCVTALFNREYRAAYDAFNRLMVVEVADPMIRIRI